MAKAVRKQYFSLSLSYVRYIFTSARNSTVVKRIIESCSFALKCKAFIPADKLQARNQTVYLINFQRNGLIHEQVNMQHNDPGIKKYYFKKEIFVYQMNDDFLQKFSKLFEFGALESISISDQAMDFAVFKKMVCGNVLMKIYLARCLIRNVNGCNFPLEDILNSIRNCNSICILPHKESYLKNFDAKRVKKLKNLKEFDFYDLTGSIQIKEFAPFMLCHKEVRFRFQFVHGLSELQKGELERELLDVRQQRTNGKEISWRFY